MTKKTPTDTLSERNPVQFTLVDDEDDEPGEEGLTPAQAEEFLSRPVSAPGGARSRLGDQSSSSTKVKTA